MREDLLPSLEKLETQLWVIWGAGRGWRYDGPLAWRGGVTMSAPTPGAWRKMKSVPGQYHPGFQPMTSSGPTSHLQGGVTLRVLHQRLGHVHSTSGWALIATREMIGW